MTEKPYTEEQIHAAMDTPPSNGSLRTIRRILGGMTAAVLMMGAAIIVLVGVVASKSHDAEVGRDVADCRALFANSIAAEQFSVILEMGRVVVETAAVHPPAPFNPAPILGAMSKYDAAVAASNAWVAAGTPLPCPIKAGG